MAGGRAAQNQDEIGGEIMSETPMTPRFVVFSGAVDVLTWPSLEVAWNKALTDFSGSYVVIGPGIVVLKLPAAAPALHDLAHAFRRLGRDFVCTSACTPLLVALSPDSHKDLVAMGVEFDDIRAK
jgi:hypothetical protein